MYAVIRDDKFTGTVYDTIKKKIIEHHNQFDEIIVKIDRGLTYDDVGNVVETPTEKELANEIVIGDDVAQESYLLNLDFSLSCIELGL